MKRYFCSPSHTCIHINAYPHMHTQIKNTHAIFYIINSSILQEKKKMEKQANQPNNIKITSDIEQWAASNDQRSMSRKQWAVSSQQWSEINEQKEMGRDQWTESNDQRSMNKKQWSEFNEQKAMIRDQWTKSNRQWAASNKQRSMNKNSNGQRSMSRKQWAVSSQQWSEINEQKAMIRDQWTEINGQWAASNDQRSMNRKQWSEINEQKAMSNEQPEIIRDQCTESNEQWPMSNGKWALSYSSDSYTSCGLQRLPQSICFDVWLLHWQLQTAALLLAVLQKLPAIICHTNIHKLQVCSKRNVQLKQTLSPLNKLASPITDTCTRKEPKTWKNARPSKTFWFIHKLSSNSNVKPCSTYYTQRLHNIWDKTTKFRTYNKTIVLSMLKDIGNQEKLFEQSPIFVSDMDQWV